VAGITRVCPRHPAETAWESAKQTQNGAIPGETGSSFFDFFSELLSCSLSRMKAYFAYRQQPDVSF